MEVPSCTCFFQASLNKLIVLDIVHKDQVFRKDEVAEGKLNKV